MPSVVLERLDEAVVEGDKRQRAPYALHHTCSKCGNRTTRELTGQYYLSYPIFGEPFSYTLYCNECYHEDKVMLVLDISLQIKE